MHPALATHRRLLEAWRQAMDLVGPGPLDPHFADADAAVEPLEARGEWADLGSGAGFPGIALAARWPEARVTLVERREKRAAFLETVVRQAGLPNLRVVCGDADATPDCSFDGVISRAFRPPAELVRTVGRLVRPGGTLVLLLAREPTPREPGFEVERETLYEVGGHPRRTVALRRQSG